MAGLQEIVDFCDERVRRSEIPDYPTAFNGLQVANRGEVAKIGAAVDAGLDPFEKAAAAGINFLIVHHGLFWDPPIPIVGHNLKKLRVLMDADCALYGSHLPLDCHPEIGNNAHLAKLLDLQPLETFLNFEGTDIGLITTPPGDREALAKTLQSLFPQTYCAIEYGSAQPERVAILTGSGVSAIDELIKHGVDTLITGELKQNHFNVAQEVGLNLYLCGHYATETFGVSLLAAEVAEKFNLPWEFVKTECPL